MPSLTWGKRLENTVTGKRDTKICNLLDYENLTINNRFKYRKAGGTRHTTFNEIKVVPYQEVLDSYWFDLMDAPPSTNKMSVGQFADGFIESMVDYIEGVWDSNKFHVILHSSGTDSRILSSILYEVYEKRGEEFFGNFLFVCWGREGKHLDLMMKTVGWDETDCVSIPRYKDEYYEYHLDFKKVPLYLNGAISYPVNDLYWIIDALKSTNKIFLDVDKVELWGAGYFNEVFKYILGNKANGIKRFLDLYYYSFGSTVISALPCTFVPSVLNPKTITYLMESKTVFNTEPRNTILKKINPDLFKIGRIKGQAGMRIPEKYISQTKSDYCSSWYGKNIAPNIKEKPVITHNDWWLRWSAAALVERFKRGSP